MKKILLSISAIFAVAALVAGVTTAFFNDTETSTGNIFIAGAIDLTVDSNGATYNGEDILAPGITWTARDLTNQKFFEFDDIKPGDYGRRNISIHVDDNLSWACVLVTNKNDQENGIVDPEASSGDVTDPAGELSGYLQLFAWQDNDWDLKYDPSDGEVELPRGGAFVDSFFDVTYSIDVADSTSGTPPLEPTGLAATRNVGLAWCAGDMSVNHITGAITCDGSGMGDLAQTDSFTADLVVYAEQHRNNPDFKCIDVALPIIP